MIQEPLQIIKDYGQLPALCDRRGEAIFDLDEREVRSLEKGTKENLDKSKIEFQSLGNKILSILEKY